MRFFTDLFLFLWLAPASLCSRALARRFLIEFVGYSPRGDWGRLTRVSLCPAHGISLEFIVAGRTQCDQTWSPLQAWRCILSANNHTNLAAR